MSQFLFVLLVLACPLMMIFMMRGHGHGARGEDRAGHWRHVGGGYDGHAQEKSVEDLRRQREELDREIAEREWHGASSGDRSPERV